MTIEKRIAALEAALANASDDDTDLQPLLPLDQLEAKLKANLVRWAKEDERRAALPLAEQLRLLRADYAAEVERRGKLTEADRRRMVPNHDVLADRLFAHLERKLVEGGGAHPPLDSSHSNARAAAT